jgi:hypothetical protein
VYRAEQSYANIQGVAGHARCHEHMQQWNDGVPHVLCYTCTG